MNFNKRVNGSWTDTPHYIHKTDTDILTTLPVDIYANDTTATVGLKGNMEQASGVSPTTPIQPQETGERTGNLCDESTIQQGYYGSRGSISTFTSDSRYRAVKMPIKAGTYTIKIQADEGIRLLRIATENEFYNVQEDNRSYTFIISADATMYVSWRNLSTTDSFTNMHVMLNTGSTALPYEPWGVKIPILLNSQTINKYLGTEQTVRQIKKLVLTGEEDIEIKSGNAKWYIPIADMKTPTNTSAVEWYCSHYQAVANSASWTSYDYMISWSTADSGSSIGLRIRDIDFLTGVTVADFKSYLAQQYANGTPITIWYILATSTTGIVNEPLRKIGDYADEVSGITIPTIAGANTISVGTTLQPSEVSVNYKGWHPVQSVHEHENGQWD